MNFNRFLLIFHWNLVQILLFLSIQNCQKYKSVAFVALNLLLILLKFFGGASKMWTFFPSFCTFMLLVGENFHLFLLIFYWNLVQMLLFLSIQLVPNEAPPTRGGILLAESFHVMWTQNKKRETTNLFCEIINLIDWIVNMFFEWNKRSWHSAVNSLLDFQKARKGRLRPGERASLPSYDSLLSSLFLAVVESCDFLRSAASLSPKGGTWRSRWTVDSWRHKTDVTKMPSPKVPGLQESWEMGDVPRHSR